MATMKIPPETPPPRENAMNIHHAFRAIINILAHRNATQHSQIVQEYETMYSNDFKKCLSSELSSHFKKAVILWMQDPAERDANIVRHALKGTVPDHKAATEVICSRNSSQIRQLKQNYFSSFGTSLEDDIDSQTSGDLRKLLLTFLNTSRHECPEFDEALVENDAQTLHKAAKKFGSDEKTFIKILSERSRAHLAALSAAH
ncbi:hypothetical protein SLE2022_144720 [Rubroshorea leprosula]